MNVPLKLQSSTSGRLNMKSDAQKCIYIVCKDSFHSVLHMTTVKIYWTYEALSLEENP